MATINSVLRKSKKKKDGTMPLCIRISEGTKNKYISVGVSVLEKDWDAESEKVKRGNPNFNYINTLILKKKTEADRLVLEMKINSDDGVLEGMKVKKEKQEKSYFFVLAEDYFMGLERADRFSRISAEKPRIKHFREFLNGKDIQFKNITEPVLKNFAIFLKREKRVGDRTVMNSLVTIRTIYSLAMKRKIIDGSGYPFGRNGIRIKYPESIKIGLNPEEVHLLEGADFSDKPMLHYTRNVWLFSFYLAGMRISDVVRLKWEDFSDDRLNYRMGKNQKIVSLKLPEKVIRILDEYRKNAGENMGYVFPEMRNVNPIVPRETYLKICQATGKFNKQLKLIAEELGIRKTLTCHISRHTFGQITGDKISPQMLQKLYRHSDIKTTMGYQSNFIHNDVDDALESVLNF